MNKSIATFFRVLALLFLTFQTTTAQWSLSIIPHFRTGNAVFIMDNQSAVIAGGNEVNDSIQTMSRTDDRGLNWGINLDIVKPWLKSIHFFNDTVGVAVGYDGTIIRTTDGGNNWTHPVAPGNTYQRHFNSVFFIDNNTGYIAGGWPSNDSIQTILKTTDGGLTWNIQRDIPGYWLRSICFTDPLHGLAVGDNGVILKTTDGGSNWNPVALTGNIATRRFNEVEFISSTTGFIVGGNKSNDSVQTILKTIDGGDNWSIISDNLGYMLNSIDFANNTIGYAVGDRGTVINTTNSGDLWNPVSIPSSVNDTFDLYGVNFFNADFGIAVGKAGKLLKYENPLPILPTVTTLSPSDISATSAKLNGLVSSGNSTANVVFQYGTNAQLLDSIVATPATVSNASNQPVTAVLSSLLPNTFYYYRVKATNSGGNNVGVTRQFYTAECEIPNCSFEDWDSILFDIPQGWQRVGVSRKVPSYNGTNAVEVTGGAINKMGAVVCGIVGDNIPEGGFAIHVRPDSIRFHAKYNIMPGDTAFIAAIFKQAGQMTGLYAFPITGSSGTNWVDLKVKIPYPNADVPDTGIVGVLSSNTFNETLSDPNSVLAVDDITFTGTTDVIPNGDFEQWTTELYDYPLAWYTTESDNIGNTIDRISKDNDHVGGIYALKLANDPGMGQASFAQVGDNSNFDVPNFPVAGRHITLNFYAKYLPQGDTLNVYASFYQSGAVVGNASFYLDTMVAQYKGFSVDINYLSPGAVPDSASLTIRLGQQEVHGNSIAFVDLMSFDGFKQTLGLDKMDARDMLCLIYPNPSYDKLNLEYVNYVTGKVYYRIVNMQGAILFSSQKQVPSGLTKEVFDLDGFQAGMYLLQIESGQSKAYKQFVVTH